jgi:hypothetical protein
LSEKTRIGPLTTTINGLLDISLYGFTPSMVEGAMSSDQDALYSIGILSDSDWEIEVFQATATVQWGLFMVNDGDSVKIEVNSQKLNIDCILHVYGPDTEDEYTEHRFKYSEDDSFKINDEDLDSIKISNSLGDVRKIKPRGVTIDFSSKSSNIASVDWFIHDRHEEED